MDRYRNDTYWTAPERPQAKLMKRLSISVSGLMVAGLLAACGAESPATGEVLPGDTSVVAEPTTDPGVSQGTTVPNATPMAEEGTPMAEEGTTTAMQGTAENPLTVAEIMQDPDAYIGQQVTVFGEAEQIFGSQAFQLDENSWLTAGIDNDLPVIGAAAETVVPDDTWLNNQYLVTGTLRNYVVAEFEQDFDWFSPGEGWTAEVEENQPVLVADSVQQVEEGTFDPGLGVESGPFENAPAGTLAVAEVTGDMEQYVGQQVTVQGEVQDIYPEDANTTAGTVQALRLDDNSLLFGGIDNDLLVIGNTTDLLTPVDEFGFDNTIVRVTGTVMEYNQSELETSVGYDLTDPVFDAWDGQAVLVADSIEVVGEQ